MTEQKYIVTIDGKWLGKDLSKDIALQLKDDALVGLDIKRIKVEKLEDG